jgi:hypothetical protein
VQSLTKRGARGHLLSINDPAFGGDDSGHLVVGAQAEPLPTGGAPGGPWSGDADPRLKLPGRLVVVRRTRVGSADAIVLRAPPYPAGGVHGGHLVLLWNADGRGQLVSLHLSGATGPRRYSEGERVEAAVRIAESFRPAR